VKRVTAKEKLLGSAEALMLADGYSRTSVDSVCLEAGVTKGSLYHYFKTKEDLGIAVLDRWISRNAEILTNGPHRAVSDPVQAALVYVQHVADSASELWHSGCFVGSLSMDIANSCERMQGSVEAIFRGFVKQHADLFQPVVDKCELEDAPSADALAEWFLASIEGSIVLAKAYGEISPISRAVGCFRKYLELLIGEPLPNAEGELTCK
jgi:TetR/AcrR family transcriptional repressor of nem operon